MITIFSCQYDYLKIKRLKSWEQLMHEEKKKKKHRDKYWSGCTCTTFETRDEGWLVSSLFQPPFRLLPFMQLAKHIIVGSRHQRTWSYGKSILALTSSSTGGVKDHPSPSFLLFRETVAITLHISYSLYSIQLDRTVQSIRIEHSSFVKVQYS